MSRKITGLGAATNLSRQDVVPMVDISDLSQAATGTTKKASYQDVLKLIERGVDIKDFQAKGDRVTPDADAWQDFIDFCSENKVPGVVTDGAYLIEKPVELKSNLNIYFTPGAKVVRGFVSTSANIYSIFYQENYAVALQNIHIEGLRYSLPYSGVVVDGVPQFDYTYTGRVMSVRCDNLTLNNLWVEAYRGAIAFILAGNRLRIGSPKIFDPGGITGEGGLRFCAGKDFLCWNGYVESGDDCFQAVPVANSSDPLFDLPIENATYINCIGYSLAARLICAALEENNRTYVKDVFFINVRGKSGGGNATGVFLSDQTFNPSAITSLTRVAGVTTMVLPATNNRGQAWLRINDKVTITGATDPSFNGTWTLNGEDLVGRKTFTFPNPGTDATEVTPGMIVQNEDKNRISNVTIKDGFIDVLATNYPNGIVLDGIKNLVLDNFKVRNTKSRAVYMLKNCKNIYIDRFEADKPINPGFAVIEVTEGERIFVHKSKLPTFDGYGVTAGAGTAVCKDVSVTECEITNLIDTTFAVNLNNVVGGFVAGNKVDIVPGQLATRGVKLGATSSGIRVVFNDFTKVNLGVVNSGTLNLVQLNLPMGSFTVDAPIETSQYFKSTGFTEDGFVTAINGRLFNVTKDWFNVVGAQIGFGIALPQTKFHFQTQTGGLSMWLEALIGTSQMVLKTSNGNFGINVNPTTGNFNIFDFTAAINRFVLNQSGNIGIGVAPSNSYQLEVVNDTSSRAFFVRGQAGAGFVNFRPQTANPTAIAGFLSLFCDANGKLSFFNTSGYLRTFDFGTVNADLAVTMRSVEEQVYGGTAAWAGTAPSGTPNIRYDWKQHMKDIELHLWFIYPTPGAANTTVSFTWPSDLPLPKIPNGYGAANDFLPYLGTGGCTTALTTSVVGGGRSQIRIHPSGTGFLIYCSFNSIAALAGSLCITFKTT